MPKTTTKTTTKAPNRAERRHPSPRWTDMAGASTYTGFAERTIRKRIADGLLPAYKPPGSRVLRIALDDLDHWVEAGRIPTGIA